MDLREFVQVYDNVLPQSTLTTFLKVCKTFDWDDATVGYDEIKKDIRQVKKCNLEDTSNSMTNVHWFNVMRHSFFTLLEDYLSSKKLSATFGPIDALQVLQYKETDHYTYHHDSAPNTPRTFSFIFFVNENFEGGELAFQNPNGTGEYTIPKKENRMIIWPSSFLFPHKVMPVKNGERYSVVAWTL